MIIKSDWHMHSEASHDSNLTLKEIEEKSLEFGFVKIGITDHVNLNDETFLGNLKKSQEIVSERQKFCDRLVLGVELTPIEKPQFDYIAKHGTSVGYIPPETSSPYGIELALSKEEILAHGIRYVIGASHWRVDLPGAASMAPDLDACIREWHRQQMFMACDERVSVLGHPWYNGQAIWYEDFSVIPDSMKNELAAALKENHKYVECNSHFFTTSKATERFKCQYAEYLRGMCEMGIPVTYGSDSHNKYLPSHLMPEKYLSAAGFVPGDIVEINENDFFKV